MVQDNNPLDPRKLARLRTSIQWSTDKLKKFRQSNVEALRQYVGAHYGDGSSTDKVPINMLKMAVGVYQRHLAARAPRVLITSRNSLVKTQAHEFGLACNHLIGEIDLETTLRMAVKNALFCLGIVKVGLTPTWMGEQAGFLHDSGQPFADVVQLDDWVHDMTAMSREQWQYCGNRYRLRYEDVMENPFFDQKGKDAITKTSDDTEMGTNGERTSQLSTGRAMMQEQFSDSCELWDIWLPRENLIVTMQNEGPPLMVKEWTGAENGCYKILAYDEVPGNSMPASPIGHLIDMHELINDLFLKVARQALRQKSYVMATAQAINTGQAEAVKNVEDGEMIRSDDPNATKEVRTGGPDQQTVGFTLMLKDLFAYLGGNMDTLGGLSQMGDTLGQEKLLKQSTSHMMADMQDSTTKFSRDVITDLGLYLYTDPFIELPLIKRRIGSDLTIPFTWGPEQREADFYEYNVQVDPYSMQFRGPQERLQQIMQILGQVVMPMMPILQQQGIAIRMDKLLEILGEYADLPELEDILMNGAALQANAPASGGAPGKPAETTRNYVRTNQGGSSGGAGGGSPMANAQMMMGPSPANNSGGM